MEKVSPSDAPRALDRDRGFRPKSLLLRMFWGAARLIAPRDPSTHFHLGNAYAFQGRMSHAIQAWSRSLDIEPRHSKAAHNLALAFLSMGEHERAVSCLERATHAAPADGELLLLLLATAHQKMGNVKAAIPILDRCASISPTGAVARALGIAYLKCGEPASAIEWLSRCTRLNPNDDATARVLALARARLPRSSRG